MARIELTELERRILEAKRAYYNGKSIMSDIEFDALEEELRKVQPDSKILLMVGADSDGRDDVDLVVKAFSTDKALSMDELKTFKNRTIGARKFVKSIKVDGMSGVLFYEEGILVGAATRGDGDTGKNKFRKMEFMNSIPKILCENFSGQIRGEFYLTDDSFSALNDILKETGEKLQSNSRNSVAGLLNAEVQKRAEDKLSLVDFRAFGVYDKNDIFDEFGSYETYEEQLKKAENLGFAVVTYKIIDSLNELDYGELCDILQDLDYAADGWVIRVSDNNLCRKLGSSIKYINGAVALKPKFEGVLTKVTDITYKLGSREFTPLIHIEPVVLGGALVTKVSGKSIKNLIKVGAYVGNEIFVVRQVIPRAFNKDCVNSYYE